MAKKIQASAHIKGRCLCCRRGGSAAGKLFEARRFIRGDGPGACRLRQPDWPDARLSVAESLPRRYRGGCRESAPVRRRAARCVYGCLAGRRGSLYGRFGLLAQRAAEVSVAGGRAKRPVRRRAARCVYGRLAGRRGSATIRHMGPFAVGRTCRTGAYRESVTIDAPIAEYLRENGAQALPLS